MHRAKCTDFGNHCYSVMSGLRPLLLQLVKFGVVGILATALDYGIMVILTEWVGVYYLLSSTISFTLSLLFNYVCSMCFVFEREEGRSRGKELVIFGMLSLMGLVLNQAVLWLLVEKQHIYYMVSKAAAAVLVMGWNFVSRKLFLEKKTKK